MPSYVGLIFIDRCNAIITMGDGNKLTPKTERKGFVGAGSVNHGDIQITANKVNKSNVIDNDVVDQGFIWDF